MSGMRSLPFPADKLSKGPEGRVCGRLTGESPWMGRAGERTDTVGNWALAPETRASET